MCRTCRSSTCRLGEYSRDDCFRLLMSHSSNEDWRPPGFAGGGKGRAFLLGDDIFLFFSLSRSFSFFFFFFFSFLAFLDFLDFLYVSSSEPEGEEAEFASPSSASPSSPFGAIERNKSLRISSEVCLDLVLLLDDPLIFAVKVLLRFMQKDDEERCQITIYNYFY